MNLWFVLADVIVLHVAPVVIPLVKVGAPKARIGCWLMIHHNALLTSTGRFISIPVSVLGTASIRPLVEIRAGPRCRPLSISPKPYPEITIRNPCSWFRQVLQHAFYQLLLCFILKAEKGSALTLTSQACLLKADSAGQFLEVGHLVAGVLEVSKTHLLAADHPAAEGFVAAEQRGAQQQPDHAAHCGAAAAAGVLRGAKAVSARRAAGALTPAPPCLPAGPTPAAQAQPPGPLHASPLAGLGAWRAAAARGCAGLERTTRRMHFQGEGTEVRWSRVCLSQR